MCQDVFIASLQCSPSCILSSVEMINTNTWLSDPHQLVSFVANKTNMMYILDSIHTRCNRSVVDCCSIVKRQIFNHLTWPTVSVKFNITMLHFVLFHSVTCYKNSLLSRIHVTTTGLHNITCTGVILRSFRVYLSNIPDRMGPQKRRTLHRSSVTLWASRDGSCCSAWIHEKWVY